MPVTCDHIHHRSHGLDIVTSSQQSHPMELRAQTNKHQALLTRNEKEICIFNIMGTLQLYAHRPGEAPGLSMSAITPTSAS